MPGFMFFLNFVKLSSKKPSIIFILLFLIPFFKIISLKLFTPPTSKTPSDQFGCESSWILFFGKPVKESNKLAEEIVDSVDKNYIYESPDGGETIYKREFGSDRRRKLSYPERANIKGKIKNEND